MTGALLSGAACLADSACCCWAAREGSPLAAAPAGRTRFAPWLTNHMGRCFFCSLVS